MTADESHHPLIVVCRDASYYLLVGRFLFHRAYFTIFP